ncbi:MAG: hypothetical protein Q9163_001938 [Psora crenata]
MGQSSPESAPTIPIPIFQISQHVKRYMLYDIHIISWLRKTHNILGVLVGTLPQIPSQNVFLGLPVELLPEEARLLVETGLAYVVDDMDWHKKGFATNSGVQMTEIRTKLQKEGLEIAKDIRKKKQARSHEALKRMLEKSEKAAECGVTTSHVPQSVEVPSEDTLFGHSQAQTERSTVSLPPSTAYDVQPWAITSASSTPFLAQPAVSSPQRLPAVELASYALFSHLHHHGYFMTPGLRFGCRFSVYPGDPLRFHSHFLAMDVEWDEEIDLWHLIGGGRLGTGVKKAWMVGGVEERKDTPDSMAPIGDEERTAKDTRVRTFCIEWGGM